MKNFLLISFVAAAILLNGKPVSGQYIGPIEGYSPHLGTLITMLDDLKDRVERDMGRLDQRELDHLMNADANSIGALVMHLVAVEVYYQELTFGDMGYDDSELAKWAAAMDLGQRGRDTLKGRNAKYYFDTWNMVRAKTIEEFRKRDDVWLAESRSGSSSNNHWSWFHVMEHQANHLGQMLIVRKHIPDLP